MKPKDRNWSDLSLADLDDIFSRLEAYGWTPKDFTKFSHNENLAKHYLNVLKKDGLITKETESDVKLKEMFAGTENYFGIFDWQRFFPAYSLPKKIESPDFQKLSEVLDQDYAFGEGKIRDNFFLVYIPNSLNNKPANFGTFISLFPQEGGNGFFRFEEAFYPGHAKHRDRYGNLANWNFSGWSLVCKSCPPKIIGQHLNKQINFLRHHHFYPLKIAEAFLAIQFCWIKKREKILFSGRVSTSTDDRYTRLALEFSEEENLIKVPNASNAESPGLGMYCGYKFLEPKNWEEKEKALKI